MLNAQRPANVRREKIFAIHQPNYIPWLGYFYKMSQCDVFVYLDTVQYPRGQNFSARSCIKTPNGTTMLTIPLNIPKGKKGKVKYTEVAFAEAKWKEKHLRTVELNYKQSPYFDDIFTLYKNQLMVSGGFVELNINLIEAIAKYLDLDTKRVKLSKILPGFGRKSELIVDVGKALNADTYLSGTGGSKLYNDENIFKENGITLIYSGFQHPTYSQLWGEFEPRLSILDVLFNCGLDTKKFLGSTVL